MCANDSATGCPVSNGHSPHSKMCQDEAKLTHFANFYPGTQVNGRWWEYITATPANLSQHREPTKAYTVFLTAINAF